MRETGVAWMGLLRKLYEKERFESVSVYHYPAECGGDETRACPEVLVEPLPKVCDVQIKRG